MPPGPFAIAFTDAVEIEHVNAAIMAVVGDAIEQVAQLAQIVSAVLAGVVEQGAVGDVNRRVGMLPADAAAVTVMLIGAVPAKEVEDGGGEATAAPGDPAASAVATPLLAAAAGGDSTAISSPPAAPPISFSRFASAAIAGICA